MTDVMKVAENLVAHSIAKYGDNICIIACYGSRARGQGGPTSDLDICYIPQDGKAAGPSSQFVIDGMPFDFWPLPWDAARDIANAKSHRPWVFSAALIADAKVLHYRTDADMEQFCGLQARIAELTSPSRRNYMLERALDCEEQMLASWGKFQLAVESGNEADGHYAGNQLAGQIANCLGLINQRYFHSGWKDGRSILNEFTNAPDNLAARVMTIMAPNKSDQAAACAKQLMADMRNILLSVAAALPARAAGIMKSFTDIYFFIVEYANKVICACQKQDHFAARADAFALQTELSELMHQAISGSRLTKCNLYSDYSKSYFESGLIDLLQPAIDADLDELADRATALKEQARLWFEQNGIDTGILKDEQDLKHYLKKRCDTNKRP